MSISLAMMSLTPVFVSTPSGTSILPSGLVIVVIALAVLVAAGWSLWRDRRAIS
jgi:hypothetical protein